jgi:Helicase conserved C-terminal domain
LKGKKVLIFSYYRDTARYLYRHLGHPENPAAVAFCKKLGGINVRRMDSGADTKERLRIIQGFAPKANGKREWVGTEREIDVLISTDVLSEGQNLQDCGYLVNYDLHWNPTRMVQRAGRIDRIGTEFETLWIYNMFPDQGLERLLGIVQSLSLKIADIDRAGFLDASVLGETVHPRNFNTLRRISEEDGSVIEEEEQFTELASSEFLMQQLKTLMDAGGKEMLDSLPDGIHSGLAKAGVKGVFFYFQAPAKEGGKLHFWKYFDLRDQAIIDNRYIIANLIACQKDTPRVVDPDIFRTVFDLQERVIADILESEEERRALEVAPRSVDPIQQTVATALQSYLNHPEVNRREAIEVIRFLNQPMLAVQVRRLRQIHREFQSNSDVKFLLTALEEMRKAVGGEQLIREPTGKSRQLGREDLRLICFDMLTSG